MSTVYPTDSKKANPPFLSPEYKSTVRRAPSKPLIVVPHTLSELTGPVYGHETVQQGDGGPQQGGEGFRVLPQRRLTQQARRAHRHLLHLHGVGGCARGAVVRPYLAPTRRKRRKRKRTRRRMK